MVNAYVANSLYGNEYYVKSCTCGYEEKFKKIKIDQNIQIGKQEFCPKCHTPLMHDKINLLTLAPIVHNKNIAILKTKNKACYFELYLYNINFTSKIDFRKRSIKVDKRTIKNSMTKIVFDATQRPKDFIKYYDDDKEISKDEFINLSKGYTYKYLNTIKLSKKFNLLYDFVSKNIGILNIDKIKKIIMFLEDNEDFFIKYEQIIKSNIDPYPIAQCIDITKTNPVEMLNIRPFTFKYIRNREYSIDLSLLKIIQKMEKKIGDKTVNYLQTFGNREECMRLDFITLILDLCSEADLSINKLYKYIYKDVPMTQYIYKPTEIIRLLKDSYEMSKELGLPFDKNPKTLQRYHDTLTEEYRTIENEVLSKKFKTVMKEKQYLNYEEKNNKYCIIIPKESSDLVKEGKELRHCVGSYIKRVVNKTSTIVFLREKDNLDKAYATIEIDDYNNIVQIKRKHNTELTNQDAINIVENWAIKNCLDLKVKLQKKGA